jgi:hypothetical protein
MVIDFSFYLNIFQQKRFLNVSEGAPHGWLLFREVFLHSHGRVGMMMMMVVVVVVVFLDGVAYSLPSEKYDIRPSSRLFDL